MENKLCFGFDLVGPHGPLPNCLNPKILDYIYLNSDWDFDSANKVISVIDDKYQVHSSVIPVFLMNYYTDYSVSKSVYDIIEDRKAGNVYDWFYIIEPYGSIIGFFNPKKTDKKSSFEFISKKVIDEVKHHNGKILINYVIDGGDGITKQNFLKLRDFLHQNDIPHSKVFLVFQDFLLGKTLAKDLNLNVNYFDYNHFIMEKVNEFSRCIKDPDYDYWGPYRNDPQVGKLYGKKSTILSHDEFKQNIKSEKKDFLTFTRHWKVHRLLVLDLLYELGLDKSLISWNKDEYNKVAEDEFLKVCDNKDLLELMKSTNRVLDIEDITKIAGYGFETKELYLNSYLSIVTESLFFQKIKDDGNPGVLENIELNKKNKNVTFISGFISEKIWKAIGHSHPFIFVGPPNSLKYMKEKFGFKTFGKWLNESYDLELNDWKRWKKIRKVIYNFSTKTIEEKQQFLIDVSPILEHNQNVFLSLDANKYKGEVVNFLQEKHSDEL